MGNEVNEIRQKIALEFKKECFARFYSHHDLMRFFERVFRRADLPVRCSMGFNPQPRMVFLSPLALGIESDCEILEIEFTEYVPCEEIYEKIAQLMVDGITVKSIAELPKRKKGKTLLSSVFRFSGFGEAQETKNAVADEITRIESENSWLVERNNKGKYRQVDIAESIIRIGYDCPDVEVEVSYETKVSARTDEICKRLCDAAGCGWEQIKTRKIAVKMV